MSQKIKAFGLALVAALALGAVAAQGASAHVFNAGSDPVYLTGTQESEAGKVNKLEITASGARVECTEAHYKGKAEGLPTGTVTVHPTYTGCTTFILGEEIPTTVDTEGCNFDLTGATDGNEHAEAHIECEAGKSIKLTTGGICDITVGEQTPTGGGVHYTTTTNPDTNKEDITVQATVTGIHYHAHGPLCVLAAQTETTAETWHGTDADFTSSITVQGYEDEAHTEPTNVTIE